MIIVTFKHIILKTNTMDFSDPGDLKKLLFLIIIASLLCFGSIVIMRCLGCTECCRCCRCSKRQNVINVEEKPPPIP